MCTTLERSRRQLGIRVLRAGAASTAVFGLPNHPERHLAAVISTKTTAAQPWFWRAMLKLTIGGDPFGIRSKGPGETKIILKSRRLTGYHLSIDEHAHTFKPRRPEAWQRW